MAYDAIVSKASEKYGVSKNLINAIIAQESGGNPNAVSSAGAQGLMQLMPATAKSLGVTNSFDPEQNIMGGTKYISQMMDKYDGDTVTALTAYNRGPGTVDRTGATDSQYAREVLARVGDDAAEEESEFFGEHRVDLQGGGGGGSSSGGSSGGLGGNNLKWWGDIVLVILIIGCVLASIMFLYFTVENM